jgi:CHAT domain-containing protein
MRLETTAELVDRRQDGGLWLRCDSMGRHRVPIRAYLLFMRRRLSLSVLLFGLLVAVLLILALILRARDETAADLLGDVLAERRLIPGRLYGAPAPPVARRALLADLDSRQQEKLVRAGRSIRSRASGRDSAGAAAEMGILELVQQDYDAAIEDLSLAVELDGRNARYLNDLSVAYLARAEAHDRPLDVVRALDIARQAVAANEQAAEARFNLALAFTELHLHFQAVGAWNEYLTMAADETDVVRKQLDALEAPSTEALWADAEKELSAAAHSGASRRIESVVRRFPSRSRLFARDLLTQGWSSAYLDENPDLAKKRLRGGRAVAEEIAKATDDTLLLDAAERIVEALGQPTAARDSAIAHQALATGIDLYRASDLEAAVAELERARTALDRLASPFARLAEHFHSRCLYHTDTDTARRAFTALKGKVEDGRYPWLAGRVQILLGLIDVVQGRDGSAIASYLRAEELLTSRAGEDEIANLHALLAEVYDQLGEVELSWSYHARSLAAVSRSGHPSRYHSTLGGAEQALRLQGQHSLAIAFIDEQILLSDAWGAPLARCYAYGDRGANLAALGRLDEALESLDAARAAAMEMPESDRRDELLSWLDLEEGFTLVTRDPARAIDVMSTAFESQERFGRAVHRIPYFVQRSQAERLLGDMDAEKASLDEAIASYEQIRTSAREPVLRMRAFARAQPAFDRKVKLLLDAGQNDEAFDVAEKARGRFLLEQRSQASGEHVMGQPLSGIELSSLLPVKTTLVHYTLLDDELVTWIFQDGDWRCVRQRLDLQDLESLVNRFRRLLESGAEVSRLRADAAALHDRLLRPLAIESLAETVVFVPDRFLARVPFAALFDQEAQSYLIEQAAVVLAPSATTLAFASRRSASRRSEAPTILIIGNPDLSHTPYRHLENLPGAMEEARAVAGLYDAPRLFEGSAADHDRFLDLLADSTRIHVAGHAVANAEAIDRSALLLAPSQSDPTGAVTLDEILGRDLSRTELVVLSSCRTMDGFGPDREGLLGLAGAFFSTGVSSVVASLWDVDDASATALMVEFHRFLQAGDGPADSLRQAILSRLEENDLTRRSPAFWAGFVLVGGP